MNSTAQLCFNAVSELLPEQIRHISEFKQHLDDIKESIASSQLERLNDLTSQTPQLLASFETLQLQLMTTLNQNGYSDPANALQQFIDDHDNANQHLFSLKQSLTEQVKALEKALLVNDLLVRKNHHRIKQSICILSGHQPSQNQATYARNGNTSESADNRHTLARA